MQISLRVESGPRVNTSIPIEPGESVTIGRDERATHAYPEDSFLSGVHFEIKCDESGCWLRDLKSSNGTTRNGAAVSMIALEDQDTIHAGQTCFSFHLQRESQQGLAPLPDNQIEGAARQTLLRLLRGPMQPLFAVIDSAREPSVYKALRESHVSYEWLFTGEQACPIAHFAPYLVPLPPESPLLPVLLEQGWNKHWGIYLTSGRGTDVLLAALRRLLVTRLPDGGQALFRFYDPRVLGKLLSCCSADQLSQLFGVVDTYLIESEDSGSVTMFSTSSHGFRSQKIPLAGDLPVVTTDLASKTFPPIAAQGMALTASSRSFLLYGDQVEALVTAKVKTAEQATLEHLRNKFPERVGHVGEKRLSELVRYGLQRPQRYGIRGEADVLRYIELMLRLGYNFDIDPKLPWATSLLGTRKKPAEKLKDLEEKADNASGDVAL